MGHDLKPYLLKEGGDLQDVDFTLTDLNGNVVRYTSLYWPGGSIWEPLGSPVFTRSRDLLNFLIPAVFYDYSKDDNGVAWTDHWGGLREVPVAVANEMSERSDIYRYIHWPAKLLLEANYETTVMNNSQTENRTLRDLFPKWYFELLKAAKELGAEHIVFEY